MASFNSQKLACNNVTLFSVKGVVSTEEIMEVLSNYYNSDYTLHMIWDFSEADFENISDVEIRNIIKLAKSYSNKRKNGKTALIPGKMVNYGLLRKYEINCELEFHEIEQFVVKTFQEALNWIMSTNE